MKIKLLLIAFLFLTGCSVIMAATPSQTPDFSVLKVGAARTTVEKSFGKPIKFHRNAKGDFATYQFFTGDKSSYQRAATYAVLDGLTLGVAELFTSPIESLQGDKNILEVLYTRNGRLKSFRHKRYNAPLKTPEKMLGLKEP